jgi:hypothetical protein
MNEHVGDRQAVVIATDAGELVTGQTNVMRAFRATRVRKYK